MARLRQAVESAVSGEGRIAIVVGEAGLGKSRLPRELRQELLRAGLGLIQGRCDPSESGTTYLPFIEALRGWLAAGRDESPSRSTRYRSWLVSASWVPSSRNSSRSISTCSVSRAPNTGCRDISTASITGWRCRRRSLPS